MNPPGLHGFQGRKKQRKSKRLIDLHSISRGFTLIEISVVLLVLTILISVLSPLLNLSIFKSTENEADLLKKSIVFCSQTAVLSNEVVYLELNLDGESYRAYRMQRGEEGAKEEEIVHPRSLSNFNSIISVTIAGGGRVTENILKIPFAPDGETQELAIYLGSAPAVDRTIFVRKYGSRVDIVEGEAVMNLENPEWEEKLEDL